MNSTQTHFKPHNNAPNKMHLHSKFLISPKISSNIGTYSVVSIFLYLPATCFSSASSNEQRLRSQKEIFRCLDNKKDEMLPVKISNALMLEHALIFTVEFCQKTFQQLPKLGKTFSKELPMSRKASSATLES